MEIIPPKREAMKMNGKACDAVWMDAGHHAAVNKGKTDFHVLVVEFKGSTKKLGK